jgi:hypothetical protein
VVQQYVCIRAEWCMPRRWPRLADWRVWCRGSVCHRH